MDDRSASRAGRSRALHVLLIHSDRKFAETLSWQLGQQRIGPSDTLNRQLGQQRTRPSEVRFEVAWVERLSDGLSRIADTSIDVLLLDLTLEDSEGIETFDRLHSVAPHVPVVVLAEPEHESLAARAIQRGAQDYILKTSLSSDIVARSLRFAVEGHKLQRELEEQRRRMGRMLRESEERGRTLFEGVPIGLYRSTPDGLILDANPALAEMLGYPYREALLAVDSADLYVSADDRRGWRERIEKDGVLRSFKMQLRRYDGSAIWVEDTAHAVRGAGKTASEGDVLYYEGSLQDITDRVHAEEALRASRASFHSIVEKTTDGVVVIDGDGIVRFANAAAKDLFGPAAGELVGAAFGFPVAVGDGVEVDLSERVGESRIAEMHVTDTEWDGEPAFLASLRDVTVRRRVQEDLARSEERFRTLVETIPYGVEEIDLSGVRLFANHTLHRIYEFDEGGLVGTSIFDQSPTEADREDLRRHLAHLVRNQPPPTVYAGKKTTRTGRVIDVEMAWDYRRDADGNVTGFTTVISDVTGRGAADRWTGAGVTAGPP